MQVAEVNDNVKIGRVIGYQSDSPGDALAYGAVVGILVSAESSGEDGESNWLESNTPAGGSFLRVYCFL